MKKINNTKKKLNRKVNNIKFKIKKQEENKSKKKGKVGRIILGALLVCGIGILLLGLIFIIYIIVAAPEFNTDLLYKKSSSIFYDKNGNEFARLGSENRELVSYSDLPQVFIDAIVATEDSRFFQHDGFDIARFTKASIGNLAGQDAGGASTITMQVVGVSGLTNRSQASGIAGIIRKFTDIYIAVFKLEKQYTKEEILEFYVNTPWLGGNNCWGVEMASQYYFGKSVNDLSLPESALLAGIFNAPNAYNPFNYPEAAKDRMDTVLNLMYRHGYITEEQLNDAKSISVESLLTDKTSNGLNEYQWFIDTVRQEIIDDLDMDPVNVAMKVYTTLDPEVQDAVNLVGNTNTYYKWTNDYEQMSVAITSVTDGSLVAIYGGRNQSGELELNRATRTTYQPGSTAKIIFDYGPAIEYNGASSGTYYLSEPYTYSNGQSISNSDGKYDGLVTMAYALARSRNIPALQAFQSVDKEKIASFAHSLGINYGDTLYESASIGAFDTVSALQLSAAYAAFGRGGYYIEPYSYTKIEFIDTDGEKTKDVKKTKVMSDSTAYIITKMLVDGNNTYGTAGKFTISGTDIAAKTGTSTYDSTALKGYSTSNPPSRDNWTIAYSPDYSISMWYGYDQLYKDYYTTMNAAYNIKRTLMAGIGKKVYKKNSKFTKPDSVVSVEVEKETIPLQLPSEYTPSDMRTTALFKVGTEPTETSTRYEKLDAPTNGKASTNGNTVYLSWDAISTPDAINSDYLSNYFSENYIVQAEKYYQKRLSYNNQYIGEVRYSVYLQNNDGTVQFLAEVKEPNYTYQGSAGTSYTFVIQANYSIYKANASDYLKISAKTSGSGGDTITLKLSKDDECFVKASTNSYYSDETSITAYDNNGNNITDKLTNVTTTITDITDTSNEKTVKRINLSLNGTYRLAYSVTYNNKTYTTSRKFTISDTCSSEPTT